MGIETHLLEIYLGRYAGFVLEFDVFQVALMKPSPNCLKLSSSYTECPVEPQQSEPGTITKHDDLLGANYRREFQKVNFGNIQDASGMATNCQENKVEKAGDCKINEKCRKMVKSSLITSTSVGVYIP